MYHREWSEPLTGRGPTGWANPLNKLLGNERSGELAGQIFKALHNYRDQVARDEDESPQ